MFLPNKCLYWIILQVKKEDEDPEAAAARELEAALKAQKEEEANKPIKGWKLNIGRADAIKRTLYVLSLVNARETHVVFSIYWRKKLCYLDFADAFFAT